MTLFFGSAKKENILISLLERTIENCITFSRQKRTIVIQFQTIGKFSWSIFDDSIGAMVHGISNSEHVAHF